MGKKVVFLFRDNAVAISLTGFTVKGLIAQIKA
jgi:hypothetical protein